MRVISIDPGKSGAVAVLDDGYADVYSLPECPKELFNLLKTLVAGSDCFVVIEKVHAMKNQGVTSTFNFGRSLGVVEGAIGALGLSPSYVTPQAWMKAYPSIAAVKDGLTDRNAKRAAGKAEALRLSRGFFPELVDKLKRKKDDGRADALLLGSFFRKPLVR